MVDKLHTENDMLVTPNDRLTASAACCCPDCTICEDSFTRTNNANINTAAPFTWTGDTSSFTIDGNRLRCAASSKFVNGCSGDRVTVLITRTSSGGSYSASQAVVKLGNFITAVVTFPSSAGELGRLSLQGSVSIGGPRNYVDVPAITNAARITLCVRQVRPHSTSNIGVVGVSVYSAHGNATVSGYFVGSAFDPDAGPYGTAAIGTGTIDEDHSSIFFDSFKVQHLKGADGDVLEDCPQCNPRPCLGSADHGFLPLADTEGKWQVYSGSWVEGAPITSFHAYSTLTSDALKFDGNARGGWISCSVAYLSTDSRIRIYMTRSGAGAEMAAADYVELVPPHGGELGCVRLRRHTGVLAATTWTPTSGGADVFCIYGAGVWYVSVSEAAEILVGPLSLQPFEPAIGLGSAPAPFAGGMELYSATIGHTAEPVYSYCSVHTASCAVYGGVIVGDDHATLPNCEWNVISGSWAWVEYLSSGHFFPTTTSSDGYIQRQVPYPTLVAGGCLTATLRMVPGTDEADLVGMGLKWAWNGGNSYVVIRFVDPADDAPNQPRGWDLACPGEGAWWRNAYKAELHVDGSLVEEAGPFRACWTGDFKLSICLGQRVIQVSDWTNNVTLFRRALAIDETYGDDPYWGVGLVGDVPAGWQFMVTGMDLAHTSDQHNAYSPSLGPTGCEPCYTPYIVGGGGCAESENLPTMVKAVVSGIEASDPLACNCDDLNGIYFLLPRYPITRYGGGTAYYGILLEANDASSCTNSIYALSVNIGTSFVNAGFSGDPFTTFHLEWQHNDPSTPPFLCSEDLVDLELTNTNNGISCVAVAGTHFKVTTIR